MTTKSLEIQQLLSAEKRAAEIVAEARKRKARRLKQAKDEAQKEIEQYKVQREGEYKALEQQLSGTKTTSEGTIQAKTQSTIASMQTAYQENKEKVLNDILALFSDIKPDTHKNFVL